MAASDVLSIVENRYIIYAFLMGLVYYLGILNRDGGRGYQEPRFCTLTTDDIVEDTVMRASKASFDSQNSLANVIRLLRIASDLSISELASKTGLSSSYICNVEQARVKPTLPTIKKFADALGVPYSSICYFDEQQSKHGYPFRKLLFFIVEEMNRLESEREEALNQQSKS